MADRCDIVTNPFTATLIRIKAHQLCRRTDFSRSDYDDLKQDMLLYLLQKAHLYDSMRGSVEAFVTNAVNTWVGLHLRHRARDKRREGYRAISLEGAFIEHDGQTDPLGTVLGEEDLRRRTLRSSLSSIELIELQDAIQCVLKTLTPSERSLLVHVATHGVASAARQRHVSRRQINKALTQMRTRFMDAGLGDD